MTSFINDMITPHCAWDGVQIPNEEYFTFASCEIKTLRREHDTPLSPSRKALGIIFGVGLIASAGVIAYFGIQRLSPYFLPLEIPVGLTMVTVGSALVLKIWERHNNQLTVERDKQGEYLGKLIIKHNDAVRNITRHNLDHRFPN